MAARLKQVDHHGDVKHREQVLAKFRAELLRESGNRSSFDRVKAKLLADREVQRDPALAAMVRSFIAEREAAFAATHVAATHSTSSVPKIARSFDEPLRTGEAAKREARFHLEQLDHQFHEQVVHFHEAEAELIHGKIVALCREHPDLATKERLAQYEATLSRMIQKRREFDNQIKDLAEKAVAAAKGGDHDSAARALKRLSSIHALHRQLLPDDRFNEIRERIVHSSTEIEHHVAARKLIEREKAVAAEIKSLAAKIHSFHKLARTLPHDSAQFRKAEAAYQRAVTDLKSHDREWLAALILDLLELLSELHDPPPAKAQRQVDHFVASVRSALAKLHREIEPSSDKMSPT
jgi:hypothetical protein